MARKPDSHHVLPLFCDDLIASCVDMTPSCFGAYMRLLCFAWTRGGLPDSEAACSRIAGGIEADDWQQIRTRLTVLEDGRLSHDRLERERAAVAEMSARKSEAGKRGNEARWASQNDRRTIAERSQNDRRRYRRTIAKRSPLILPLSFPEKKKYTHTRGQPTTTFGSPDGRQTSGPGSWPSGTSRSGLSRGGTLQPPMAGRT